MVLVCLMGVVLPSEGYLGIVEDHENAVIGNGHAMRVSELYMAAHVLAAQTVA